MKALQKELLHNQKQQLEQEQDITKQQAALDNQSAEVDSLKLKLSDELKSHEEKTRELVDLQTKSKLAFSEVSELEESLKNKKREFHNASETKEAEFAARDIELKGRLADLEAQKTKTMSYFEQVS